MAHVRILVEATNRLDSCILYTASVDIFEPDTIRFSELWPDQATFSRHMEAPHIVPWRAAVVRCGVIERHFVAYEICGSREL